MSTATSRSAVSSQAYAQEDLVTGEGVSVDLPIASVITRTGSRVIDLVITAVLFAVAVIGFEVLTGGSSEAVVRASMIALVVIVGVILPVTFETLTRGRTPGKYVFGLLTVRDDSGPIVLRHSIIRQLVAFVEIYLLLGGPAMVASVVHPRAKRLGDMAAGTYVISVRTKLVLNQPPEAHPALVPWATALDIGPMPAPLAVATRQYLARTTALTPEAQRKICDELLGQVLQHISPGPPPNVHPEWILRTVMAERRRRDLIRLHEDSARVSRLLPQDNVSSAP